LTPSLVLSQEKYDLDLPLFVWNSYIYNRDFENLEMKTYLFTIDATLLHDTDVKTISNITMRTDVGVITFHQPLAPQTTFILGSLDSDQVITKFNIIQVLGMVDNKQVDLTDSFRARSFSPIPMEVVTPMNKSCLETTIDFNVYVGVYKELEIGDFQHAYLDIQGKAEDFLFNDNVSYFFENEANYGKRIKIFVETNQTYLTFDGEEAGCLAIPIITKFIEIRQ
jgi:hypothetical protein